MKMADRRRQPDIVPEFTSNLKSASETGVGEEVLRDDEETANNRKHLRPLIEFAPRIWATLKSWLKMIIVFLVPLCLLPLPLVAASAAYIIFIIAVYWMTEALPLVATSLLPLILFPVTGVLSAEEVAVTYLNDTSWLLIGGLMVAIAVEKWDLHKRLALWVLLLMGSRPSMLLFGFMASTGFLSMWLNNTATAAMMLPIAQAVLSEFEKCTEELATDGDNKVVVVGYNRFENESEERDDSVNETQGGESLNEETTRSPVEPVPDVEIEVVSDNAIVKDEEKGDPDVVKVAENETVKRLGKGLMIGVAYAANIGGMATLTGSGPNLVLRGVVQTLFPGSTEINFGVWFVFGFPTAVIVLFGAWVYLTVLFCDDSFQCVKKRLCSKWKFEVIDRTKGRSVIKAQYRMLGPIKYAEILVLLTFVLLVLLWFLRDPKFIPGWGALFPTAPDGTSDVSDASAVMFVAFLLFLIPSKPCLLCTKCRQFSCSQQTCVEAGGSDRLLDWNSVHLKLPWDVILLLGSGFAMARAAECSGLSEWIEGNLHILSALSPASVAFLVTCLVAVATQVMVNVASTTLFLPIVAKLGVSLGLNPLYLMIPAAVTTSFACILPVSSTPSAMVFTMGYFRVYDLLITGIPVSFIGIVVLNFAINTYGVPLFNLSAAPEWNTPSNMTTNATNYLIGCQ